MNYDLTRRTVFSIAVTTIIVLLYVGTLIAGNYHSRMRFIDASRKRYVMAFEKQAMVLGYFLSERKQDLVALSNAREVATYFENKALGMSLKYGLGASLMDMAQSFSTLVDSRRVGEERVYNWIAFVQPDGLPVTAVSPQVKMALQKWFQQKLALSSNYMGINLKKRNKKNHAIITTPYFFKQSLMGYIVADITLETVFNHLLDTRDVGGASGVCLFWPETEALFMTEDPVLAKLIKEHLGQGNRTSGFFYLTGMAPNREKQALVFARVIRTPFLLIKLFSDNPFSSGINPRDALLAMVLLFLLVFGSMGFLLRSTIQKQILASQVEASTRNAREFQHHNETLSMEIAERKKMERALEKANRELGKTSITLNCILNSATEFAILAMDSEYRIIHFNPAAERLLGIKKQEILGQRFSDLDLFSIIGNDQFQAALAVAREQGKYEYDYIWQNTVDGGRRFHSVVMPMVDNGGVNVGFILFMVDITARHRSEKKLRLSEERYRTLVENMPDIVFTIDEKFLITTVNIPQGQPYTPEPEDIVGRSFELFIHEKDRKRIRELTRMDFKEKRKYRRGESFRILSDGGGSWWVDLNLHYQYNRDGGFAGANGVLTNITERKLLEAQLVRTERLAAAGQLAASIAHEINSPLAGISALLALVRTKNSHDKNALEEIDLIRHAFESIGNIVQKLLNLNRPSLDRLQRANVNTIIQDTVKLSQAYLKKKGISVRLDLSDTVPDFDCYPQELGQVLLNLINNTIEAVESATGAGGDGVETLPCQNEILITTRASADKINVDYVDTGPGIPREDLDRIFDPFFTGKKSLGFGFGLSICHDIILRHHGVLQALEREGGAWFTISFLCEQEIQKINAHC